jgi:predicted hydrocarbon binding protein
MNEAEEAGRKYLELYKNLTPEPPIANESGVIKRLKQDWVILGLRYYPYQFTKIMSDIAGEEVSADCMYRFGYGCGKEIGNRYVKEGKEGIDVLKYAIGGSVYFGWGAAEIIEYASERVIIRFYNSYEARSYFANNKKKTSKPQCNYLRGVITSVCAVAWNKEAKGEETKCLAKGDEYCEFEATPKGY